MAAGGRFGPFVNAQFARLWAAQGLSFIGDQVFDTTLVVYVAAVLVAARTPAPAVESYFGLRRNSAEPAPIPEQAPL